MIDVGFTRVTALALVGFTRNCIGIANNRGTGGIATVTLIGKQARGKIVRRGTFSKLSAWHKRLWLIRGPGAA